MGPKLQLFSITIEWTQRIIEHVYQDETRGRGSNQVESIVLIVAPDEELARLVVERSMKYNNVQVKKVEAIPVNYFVTWEIIHSESVGNSKNDKMIKFNNDDPHQGDN